MGAETEPRSGEDASAPTTIGRYRVLRRIGAGGMGEVWVARHARLARPAAIKFIRVGETGSMSPAQQSLAHERFTREAEATASLRSPHTVEVYDFGVTTDGRFYYAMELLDGIDLEQMVARFGPMPPARAVFLLRQILESLHE
ncbi:MAG: serine/threonine protein kinase, partial [Myxococcales bacterium]|nr:serine/threonine protein kinase [Myxococcales bacterium]